MCAVGHDVPDDRQADRRDQRRLGEQQSIEQELFADRRLPAQWRYHRQPTQATKVEFIARSEIDETTLVDLFGAVDRYYELSLQHAFWRYLVLGTYVHTKSPTMSTIRWWTGG